MKKNIELTTNNLNKILENDDNRKLVQIEMRCAQIMDGVVFTCYDTGYPQPTIDNADYSPHI